MKLLIIAFFINSALAFPLSTRRWTRKMAYALERDIKIAQEILTEENEGSGLLASGDQRLYLHTLRLRFRGFVSIGVTDIAKVKVLPYFELYFQRKNPAGYDTYTQ